MPRDNCPCPPRFAGYSPYGAFFCAAIWILVLLCCRRLIEARATRRASLPFALRRRRLHSAPAVAAVAALQHQLFQCSSRKMQQVHDLVPPTRARRPAQQAAELLRAASGCLQENSTLVVTTLLIVFLTVGVPAPRGPRLEGPPLCGSRCLPGMGTGCARVRTNSPNSVCVLLLVSQSVCSCIYIACSALGQH